MVKRSPVELLHAGTVHSGKYLILIGGGTAEVEESYREGMQAAPAEILDEVFLPQVHPRVVEALDGDRDVQRITNRWSCWKLRHRRDCAGDRCRGERRAGRSRPNCGWGTGLGGRGLAILTGMRTDVEAAADDRRCRASRAEVARCATRSFRTYTNNLPSGWENRAGSSRK